MNNKTIQLMTALVLTATGILRAQDAEKVWFGDYGNPKKRYYSLSELEKEGLTIVKSDWPFGAKSRYEGIPLKNLVASAKYFPKGQKADTLVVHCRDGFWAFLPIEFIRTNPILLVTRVAGKGPRDWPLYKNEELGLFLALPSAEYPKFNEPKYNHYWARQVEGFALVDLADKWVGPAFSKNAAKGRTLFLQECIHCHELYGFGGVMGPSFSRLMTESKGFFVRYVNNPGEFNPRSKMPPFKKRYSTEDTLAIFEFLKSVPTPK